VNPLEAHPAPSADGLQFGILPLEEPVRELRGFPLGTILLRLGLVPEEPINEALAESVQARKPLGRFLVERGVLEETDIARALAIQKGFPFVPMEDTVVDRRATSLIPAHMANRVRALPLGYAGTVPVVAVADPTNREAIDEICATIGGDVVIAAASPEKLQEAIVAAYCPADEPATLVPLETAPSPPASAPAPEPAPAFRVVAATAIDRVVLAACRSLESAEERARELIAELAADGWISCHDGLLRAESIVSIDVAATPLTP
jgi:type II secretion system (T2SS) protein E